MNKKISNKKIPQQNDASTKSFDESDFPIVGIGASAGGLEALEVFFKNLPSDTNMAFVVIQHLDPTRKGILPELIQRFTSMKVIPITENLQVIPNCVYVIPSNTNLSISNRFLHLAEPVETRGLRLPINYFFNSLADDIKDKSIGVILSGMGEDGSLGLASIKSKSGLVLVQDPQSAKFDSMPKSAIRTVQCDFVASAEELPNVLVNYASNKPVIEQNLSAKDVASLDKIIALLFQHKGHDFTQYKNNTLFRRIERRMGINQISTIADYFNYLNDHPKELDILFKDILIGVTNFFRDTAVWEKLSSDILPPLFIELPDDYNFRVWVPGCSTGEEAYSLAMIFKEVLDRIKPAKKILFQIFATDIDAASIDKARMAVYPEFSIENLSKSRLNRFFTKTDSGFRINTEIREMVVFAPQNVTKDPPFIKIDFISCRNMLIYMELKLQQKLLKIFNYCLNPDGMLLLGGSESLGALSSQFKTIDSKLKIYKKLLNVPPFQLYEFHPSSHNILIEKINKMNEPKNSDSIQALADKLLLEMFSPTSVMTNDKGDILYITGRTGNFLEPAAGKASMNIFSMAREGLKNKLSIGFNQASHSYKPVFLDGLRIDLDKSFIMVDVKIQKIESPEALNGMFMFIFSNVKDVHDDASKNKTNNNISEESSIQILEAQLLKLREELQLTVEQKQTSQEELSSANEELQSSNEELQSTNEELTTSKEEMQSLNEELQAVNAELQNKIEEYIHINNDLKNLFDGTDIAALFLDKNFHIRRFTRQTTTVLKLIPTDVGRPFTDISSDLDYPEITTDAHEVLRTLVFVDKTVKTHDARWFNVKILPYRTIDDRIDGLVITFSDITQPKILENELKKANETFQNINKDLENLNIELKKSEKNYRDLLSEKELILKEVHHRIKNNMSTIFSLLRLQADTQESDFTKNSLLDAASRVHSMMILYDKLYRTEGLADINLKNYMPSFIQDVVNLFDRKPPIKVNSDIEDIYLDIHMISSLGILITELITNSMKYAFKNNEKGEINVSINLKDDRVKIIFEDSGPGLPDDFKIKNSNGFGMLLIDTLVNQINGNLVINNGQGARYCIEFDNKHKSQSM